jgi:hypothetical protein
MVRCKEAKFGGPVQSVRGPVQRSGSRAERAGEQPPKFYCIIRSTKFVGQRARLINRKVNQAYSTLIQDSKTRSAVRGLAQSHLFESKRSPHACMRAWGCRARVRTNPMHS